MRYINLGTMPTDYQLFFKFIEAYSNRAFAGIDPEDPLNRDLEKVLVQNRQFFYIADMIQMKILYVSNSTKKLLGVKPGDFDPYVLFNITHPDDIKRHASVRGRVIRQANELFARDIKHAVLSTNLRLRDKNHSYTNYLNQCYMWLCHVPRHTVCGLFVQTDISWFGELKHGYNAYNGTDLEAFRFPDEKLIMTGYVFSDREFEIIKLVWAGMSSEDIAEKIFLSTHTVNTHRRNILKKTGKNSMPELLHELHDIGIL